MLRLHKQGHGDQIVKVLVKIPTAETAEEKHLVEEIKKTFSL